MIVFFRCSFFEHFQSGKSAVAFWFLRVLNRALTSFIDFSYLHIFYEVHLLKVIRYDFSVILRVLNRTLARFIYYSSLY